MWLPVNYFRFVRSSSSCIFLSLILRLYTHLLICNGKEIFEKLPNCVYKKWQFFFLKSFEFLKETNSNILLTKFVFHSILLKSININKSMYWNL